jgi:5-hydroxyisourate hydrolase
MSNITTHILDLSAGKPAAGVAVTLEAQSGSDWTTIGKATTDSDGRVRSFVADAAAFEAGVYRLIFETEKYFADKKTESFYPQIVIPFTIREASQHFHVPLLLSSFGYSTYRGS